MLLALTGYGNILNQLPAKYYHKDLVENKSRANVEYPEMRITILLILANTATKHPKSHILTDNIYNN